MPRLALPCFAACAIGGVHAQEAPARAAPAHDAALARRVGADERRGMRGCALVILKTGPRRMPDDEARKAMLAGHFARLGKLADAGKGAPGPFSEDPDGWRGSFLPAVDSV